MEVELRPGVTVGRVAEVQITYCVQPHAWGRVVVAVAVQLPCPVGSVG
jgi:hypothetical protein